MSASAGTFAADREPTSPTPTTGTTGGGEASTSSGDGATADTTTKQWGTSESDRAASVVVDSSGALVVSGTTYGDLGGEVGDNDSDAFIAIVAP